MKQKHALALAVVSTLITSANAQLVEVVSSSIDVDTVTIQGTNPSFSSSSHIVTPITFEIGGTATHQWGGVLSPGDLTSNAIHSTSARIRVKWIGAGTPGTILYTAKFRVWGIRYFHAYTHLMHSGQSRSIFLEAMLGGNFLPLPRDAAFLVESMGEGDVEYDDTDQNIWDNSYPVFQGAQNGWTSMGEHAVLSTAFSLAKDGFWYSNIIVPQIQSHIGMFDAEGSGWHMTDASWAKTDGRTYYELFEFGNEPIQVP